MPGYTVKQLAQIAGISVRTLHHYDQIGLLKPSARSEGNYRLYQHPDLLRLQQILFYRELDVPLKEIPNLLRSPELDQIASLQSHRNALLKRKTRLNQLIQTIDGTLASLRKEQPMLSDEDLYKGFSKEEIEQMNKEVDEKYDPERVAESRRRIRNMSKPEWEALQAEGGRIFTALAGLMDGDPKGTEAQALVAEHHAWIERFYPAPADVYRGLGEGYAADDRFRSFFDRIRPSLADFLQEAMAHYADTILA